MKVHRIITIALVAGTLIPATASAQPTLQGLAHRLAVLSQRVHRDEQTIRRLRAHIAAPQFTIRRNTAIAGASDIGQARCQPGETVIGGGAGWGTLGSQSSSTQDFLRYSIPFRDDAGMGWRASGFEPFGKEFQPFTIYAVCAR